MSTQCYIKLYERERVKGKKEHRSLIDLVCIKYYSNVNMLNNQLAVK